MPEYEIEQYELHTMKYRVKAKSPAHAIKSRAMLLDAAIDAARKDERK